MNNSNLKVVSIFDDIVAINFRLPIVKYVMRIYLIPGLGADRRMYNVQLKVIENATVLEHLPPNKNETLTEYAQRLIPLIDTTVPFVLVGTSLGGMIALELTKYIKPEKVILIASIKGRDEMPLFMRAMKYLKLHRLLKGTDYKRLNNLMVRRLDSRGDSPAAELIRQMTIDARPEFIEWAINAVIHWQPGKVDLSKVHHIHGQKDQLFPWKKIKNARFIAGGSHVMNITKSREVNNVLLEILNKP